MQKKTKCKHCHVGLLEITPSISEKPACSRTEEEMINKITKRGIRLEKDKKLQYRWSMLRNSQISYGKEIARRPATSNEQVITTNSSTGYIYTYIQNDRQQELTGIPYSNVVVTGTTRPSIEPSSN